MTIIAKLKLAAWVPLFVALIIGSTLLVSHRVMEEAQEKGRAPQQIINAVHMLTEFARSYWRYQEERPKEQFLAEHAELARFAAGLRFKQAAQRQTLNQILDHLTAMGDTFHKLVINYEQPDITASPGLYAEAEERLSNQFLIRASDAVARSLRLKRLIDEEITATQDHIYLFIILLIAFTTVPITVILLRMMYNISDSYRTLRRGAEIIAEGNLDHVIGLTGRDELTQFARAFDLMTRRLRETTVSKNELERRVRERTAELQERADQLARMASELTLAEQRERRRLAEVLHDHLQQLLAGARFRLEGISRGKFKNPTETATQIIGLLDEAIAASRSLTVELSPPILHEGGLTAGMEWLVRWMKEKHDLTVDLKSDPRLAGERECLREDVRILVFQAVRELLFNVVKHAGTREATVELGIGLDDALQVMVRDHGKGFDPKAALAGSRENLKGGFGLFSIQERLALLGGGFEMESADGQGARFRLTAPRRLESTVPRDSTEKVAVDLKAITEPGQANESVALKEDRIRLLLADDHQVMREGLASLLVEEPDLEIVGEASDGEEALELARQLNPDVVLMDFSMPRMNGIEATRRLRKELPEVQVIGLSMYEEPDRSEAMLAAGARAYLTKSGKSDILIQTIRRVHPETEPTTESKP
ncbi:MAG: response regulator [Desulfococcaceae bacterium]